MKKCQPRSLTPFLDGELTEDAWQELDEHLQSCPSCTAQLDELTAASQQVRAMGRAKIPGDALKSALDIIAVRAGLTGEAAITETIEIARAPKVAPQVAPKVAPQIPPQIAPQIARQIVEEHWPLETDVAAGPDAVDAGDALVEAEAEPTWIEPEGWHPSGPPVVEAPPFVPSPPAVRPGDLAADAAPNADAESPTPVEDVEPPPGVPGLDTHPSPPPEQLVPSWMDAPVASDAELEEVGRAAVDDAIEASEAEADGALEATAEDVEVLSMADYTGATAAAEAELRAPIEPATDVEPAATGEPRRPWYRSMYASIFARRSSQAVEATPGIDPVEPALDTPKRPEAERLMWITPRPPVAEPEGEPAANPEPESEATPAVEAVDQQAVVEPTMAAAADPEPEPTPVPEVAADMESPAAAPADEEEVSDASHLRGYREALVGARARPVTARSRLLSPDMRMKVGLGTVLVVIVAVAGVLLATRQTHPTATAATQPATSHAAAPSPATTSSLQPSAAASPASGPAVGTLSELVTAGAGGSGWAVSRIRLGSPGNGITRMVFDLGGSGATPTAQVGRSSDGNIYLSVPGLSISPDTVTAMTPGGAITGISQASAAGTALKITTNGSPGFSMAYYPASGSAPTRLVLDFK